MAITDKDRAELAELDKVREKFPKAYERYRRHATKIQDVFKVLTNKPLDTKPNTEKEYYNGFMAAFKSVAENLTNYEKKHGLYITKITKPVDKPDVKLIMRETNDGQKSLILFFRNSVKYDIWKFWLPSKDQFTFLTKELPVIIEEVEHYNSQFWTQGGGCK